MASVWRQTDLRGGSIMERYIIKNNVPIAPPRCGVTANGRVVSNFAARIQSDESFAVVNGYYPLSATPMPDVEFLEEGELAGEGKYVLKDGEWVYERA